MKSGQYWEEKACQYLMQQGLRLLARNWRCRQGEVDLIMRHSDVLVFVEVKYRSQAIYGSALEAVTAKKLYRMRQTARHFLRETKFVAEEYRFDVVAIEGGRIHWLKGVTNQ